MSHHAEPCITGCTIRGQHLDAATGNDDRHATSCRGCAPREAAHGRLCPFCWQRLVSDIATLPHLVRHLRIVGHPTAAAPARNADVKAYRDPAEGTVVPEAWTAADELHALLASWCDVIADHPHQRPPWAPPPTRRAWRAGGATTGILDVTATDQLVRWVGWHLHWAAGQDWAGTMRAELGKAVAAAGAQWPVQDVRTRHITGVPCVACHRHTLAYTPTTGYRRPFTVACTHPECGRLYTEDEHDRLIERQTA